MKRIDDKIIEIEKKDKTNRLLFYGIIGLIIIFLVYVNFSEKAKKEKDEEISELTIKNSETYIKLEDTYEELRNTHEELKNSLRPIEYWNHIESENSNEGYISYLTNDWGIDKKDYIPLAIEKLKSANTEGFEGWLFVGSKNNEGTYENRDVIDIIYRQFYEGETATLKNLEPQVGDIVRLQTALNRKTYQNKNITRQNEQGWRNKTRGFITEVHKEPNSTNFNVKIKYY